MDNWNIVCLMKSYNRRYQETTSYEAQDFLDYIYPTAIRLQIKMDDHGDIFPIADFCDSVRSDCITDYDGMGKFISEDGETLSEKYIKCDVDWILRHKNDYKFIIWYNK